MNRACYPHGGKSPCILNLGVRRRWVSRLQSDGYLETFRLVGEGKAPEVRGAEIPCCSLVDSSGHPARYKWTNHAYSRAQRVSRARAEWFEDVQQDVTKCGAVPCTTDALVSAHRSCAVRREPSFVCAFAKLRQATISFAMSVRPSVVARVYGTTVTSHSHWILTIWIWKELRRQFDICYRQSATL